MRVAVTGTPGTGKTTATEHLDTDLDIVHLNDVIQEEGLYTEVDEARDSKVADLDAVRDWLEGREDVLVESHLSHLLDADRVVVLRCAPGELERRLIERGEPAEKAEENAESEALDVILSEAVREHGKPNVYEIDTTDRDPEVVADDIEAVLAGERDPSAGEVDFTEYL
ncbi:adenylate kinase family protein [Halobacterium sp. KA-4]|uniref:adenylate kinase family protein n=1 Tax=Halobacterium sp. KA-4 TaxID=2896367 RepID=UPI001E511C44|nr:adenylate kinase family protein [Halobacterium sp. KA-4]MCD2199396.1 adenylate kinase family protein [Halobacterium sp. KA-4]